jgi:hypothetical protein
VFKISIIDIFTVNLGSILRHSKPNKGKTFLHLNNLTGSNVDVRNFGTTYSFLSNDGLRSVGPLHVLLFMAVGSRVT